MDQEITDGYADYAGNAAITQKPERPTTEIIRRLQVIADRTGNMHAGLRDCADRMFGPQPEVASGEGPANSPSGDIDQIRSCLEMIERRFDAADEQARRLSQI